MKRVLSLILALVMILGTLPMAFAADTTAGEMLKASGFVAGDENGNLNEGNEITRAELAVLVAELNGVKENAKTYAIAPEFKDVKADEWFAPYVAYAAKEGWFKGDDAGNFNPQAKVSAQVMATVMLRALGYEPAWETAVSEAKAMGLPVGAADAATMTRGEAFSTMWGVVNTPKKDSDVALGVELGKIEPATPVMTELEGTIDFARAYGNALINVDFKANVDAAAAGQVSNYSMVEKADTTKEISILSVMVEDGDDVVLETEALTAGKAYTVMVGDSKANFTGVKKDSDKPAVDSVKGKDTGEVEVVFEDAFLDRASAEDVANYSMDKEGTIVKAVMDAGRLKVTLTVEGMTTTKSKKLTIENVQSTDGVVMTKATKSFGPKFDKTAPKIDDVKASAENNTEVLITWKDDHGVDKATAEDISNYSIEGLEIISAKATYKKDAEDDYYDKVILTTAEQKKSKKYELEIKHMIDGSTAANATSKVLKDKFTGGSEDDDKPKVKSVSPLNLTEVEVIFTEDNVLDVATVLDASNYTFKDDKLNVENVKFDDADDNANSYSEGVTGVAGKINEDNNEIKVILTVSEMEEKESYKLAVNNIGDNFGNVMDKKVEKTVRVSTEIKSYYQIKEITANDLEKITVEFNGKVREDSAEDATNYVLDGGIGAVKKATLKSGDTKVELVVPKLTIGKTYKLTVNGVENTWGYAAEDVVKSFIAANDEVDTIRPEVEDVDYSNKGEVIVTFSEPMKVVKGTSYVVAYDADLAVNKDADKTNNSVFRLLAVDTRDDDKVVVFNAYEANSATYNETTKALSAISGSASIMVKDDQFELASFSADVTDLAKNSVDYTDKDESFSTDSDAFDLTNPSDDKVEADGLSQENGNTVEVSFSRPIKIAGEENYTVSIPYDNDDSDTTADDGNMEFTYEVTGDDDDRLTFTKTSGTFPKDSVELHFNFAAMTVTAVKTGSMPSPATVLVQDVLSRDASNEVGKVDVDNDDDISPTLTEVKVVDNETLLLMFDEKLKSTGSYAIKNTDDDDSTVGISVTKFDDADKADVVKLTLSKKLTDDNYELSFKTSPRDLANNQVSDKKETFSFVGVDTAAAVKMVAAKVDNATQLTIVNDIADFATGGTNVITFAKNGTDVTAGFSLATLTKAGDELDVTVRPYYALLKKDAADKAVTYTFDVTTPANITNEQAFVGTLEEDDVTITTDATTIVLATDDISYDIENFAYYLVTAADTSRGTEMTATVANYARITEGTGADAGKIVLTENGSFNFVAGTSYKLIVAPKDDGAIQDSIEVISEAFTY